MAAIISALTQYKLGKSTRRRFIAQTILWLIILSGLLVAQPLYDWLYNNELTQTEPLSLFDVIQITAIVITFYIANRTYTKLEEVELKLNHLHQELAIRLSGDHEQ